MTPQNAVEIDEPDDWNEAERLLNMRKRSAVNELLKNISLLAFDVDGTLTDRGMYYSARGEELKKFNQETDRGWKC